MKFKVDPWNNFCRVFEMPETYPQGYCFGGGKPVEVLMVDWFYPVHDMGRAAVSKEVWSKEVGPVEDQIKEIDGDELIEMLSPFIAEKNYTRKGKTYVVICDFGLSFTVK